MVALALLGILLALLMFAGLRWTLVTVGATLLLLAISVSRACACNTKEKAYTTAMRSDLRNLVDLQERNHQAGRSFLYAAPDTGRYRLSTGVVLIGMQPTSVGFVASVGYPAGTTTRCQVWHAWGTTSEPTCHPRR